MNRAFAAVSTIAVMACVAPAALAQSGPRDGGHASKRVDPCGALFDPKTVETVGGVVEKVEFASPAKGAAGPRGTHLTLRTKNGLVAVHLGPEWFVANQEEEFRAKDEVEATGSRVAIEGKPALIAIRVAKGDRVLELRDESGAPLWSRWRSNPPRGSARPEGKGAMSEVRYRPIGVIHSSFTKQAGTPVQSVFADGVKGWIDLDPAYEPALKDLDGFERIWVVYHLDRAAPYRPLVLPYLGGGAEHGLFATRSPPRPNPIGLSVLRLVAVKGGRIDVEGMDILDGTPLLDIKPYVPKFDAVEGSKAGWFDLAKAGEGKADGRFEK